MLSSVALWALLATTSHAAYVQSRDCSTDTANFRLIPEGLRASVNVSRDTFDTDFYLVANYFNGTECNSTAPLDLVPVFTVVDYNGVHQYPGRIVNTSCAKYGPLEARLRLEITSTFNRSTLLDVFEITLDLTTHDDTPLLCVEANLTPEVRLWTRLVSFWLPVLVFSVASLVASWPLQRDEHHAIFPDAQNRNNNHHMTRAAEMLAYIQFIYFSGALSLRYPGFLQPIIGFTSWSTLMLPAGPVSNQSRYVGVRDGIYETNGTLTGAPGFVILSQITSSPGMSKNWFNTIAFALIVLLFFFVAIHVRELLREQGSPNSRSNKSQEPLSRFRERSWAVARLFLSLFMLPLSAWSTYQLSDRRMVLQNSAVAIVALVLLLSSFWWTWMQANSSADIGLFVIPGETRVRGKKSKEQARKYHALNIFCLMLFRGIIIGGLQAHTRTQFGVLLGLELLHLLCTAYWSGGSALLSLTGVLYESRVVLFSLHTAFLPGVTDLPSKILLGYIILSWHLAVLIGIFLIPIFLDLVHRGLAGWTAKAGATEAEKTAPAMRVSSSSESDRSTKGPFSAAGTYNHGQYLADVILSRELRASSDGLNHGVSVANFLNFMKNVQGEDPGTEKHSLVSFLGPDCFSGLDTLEAQISPKSPKILISEIIELLLSKQNLAIQKTPLRYDLDRPINEYFICSSHNTYLMGRQVLTRSTVQGYISALSQGCRSIEVDCWDGRDGQPIVKHGYSLTASIGFQDVIDAINQYAFVASDFPLWISLEVHCSPRQKNIMAQIMRDTFGSKLVTEPLSELSGPLPSPSQLRGRILIKAKVAKGVDASQEPRVSNDISVSARSSQDHGSLTEGESTDSTPSISSSISQETSSQGSQSQPSVNGPLEELAIYGPGKRLPRPSKVDATGNFVYSVSEANFKSYLKHKDGGGSLGFLNTRHMVRVYPDASRIDSSNLSPLQYWRYGVQMTALNYQTSDLNMGLNQAMFNGGTDNSGYALKPERLRQPLELTRDHVQELRFSIDVLMTKDLCWPETTSNNASVYVQIKFLTADAHKQDASQTKRRTKSIPLQRHDVILDSRLDFEVETQYPSLVFLKWSVKLSSDTHGYPRQSTLASGMAKLENLKQGYRLLPLKRSFQDEEDCGFLVCKLDRFFCDQDEPGSEGVGK
ncbi:Phosphoinositide phospholipase C [Fusarium sp. LHS14.1]|nr:Phosphoinositide phospholipase C [Fusarium sp. LHS14.1]